MAQVKESSAANTQAVWAALDDTEIAESRFVASQRVRLIVAELCRLAAQPAAEEVLKRIAEREGGRVGLAQAVADMREERASLIVIDASVPANVVGDDGQDGRRAREEFAHARAVSAPDLVDVETVSVLRKRWIAGTLTGERFGVASTT